MDRELIDRVWKILPAEFKEEVKRVFEEDKKFPYYSTTCGVTIAYHNEKGQRLIDLFGIHNLTSDEDGEEMLTVSRKKVQELYSKHNEQAKKTILAGLPDIAEWDKMQCNLLQGLFGSKCLPDEEPKPAEPKFYVGQKVKFKGKNYGFEVTAIEKWDDCDEYQYKLAGWRHPFRESDLEPCTEP